MKDFIFGFGFCFCLLGLFILFDNSYYYSYGQFLLTILFGMGISFSLMGVLRKEEIWKMYLKKTEK